MYLLKLTIFILHNIYIFNIVNIIDNYFLVKCFMINDKNVRLFLDSNSSKSVFERIGATCDREEKSPGLVSKSGMLTCFLLIKISSIL